MSRVTPAVLIVSVLALAGCSALMPAPTPTPTPAPDGPVTSNDPTPTPAPTFSGQMVIGEAVVDSVDFLILESFPVQIRASVKGTLPDNCTKIGEITQSRDLEKKTFTVHIATQRPAAMMCTLALVPYEQSIALDVNGLPKGMYIVTINGYQGSFELTSDNVLP